MIGRGPCPALILRQPFLICTGPRLPLAVRDESQRWSARARRAFRGAFARMKKKRERRNHEENLSAQSYQAAEEARLSLTNEDEGGTRRHQATPREGSQATRPVRRLQIGMLAETGRFKRSDRVRQSIDYRRISRTAQRRRSAEFVVLMAPARAARGDVPDEPVRRLGLTVSRKVGNAVTRNYVKRRVREWFRAERSELPPGTEWVVIAQPAAGGLRGREIADSLRRALASRPSPSRPRSPRKEKRRG